MLIIFTVEIKSRSPGNTQVNKVKCSSRFQRLKYEKGSHKMKIKADRYNPSALEGKKTSYRSKQQEGKNPENSNSREIKKEWTTNEICLQYATEANVIWGCVCGDVTSRGRGGVI